MREMRLMRCLSSGGSDCVNFGVSLGATSSGKFANAACTGQFNIFSDSNRNGYLSVLGKI